MSKSLVSEVLETFQAADLPEEITERFYILELLARNDLGETYLLSEKDGEKRLVLKSFRHSKPTFSESEILKGLKHKGLPIFEPEILFGDTVFTLREYINGMSLEEYLEEHKILDEGQAVNILLELCDIFSALHSQTPPIIHRDIKPSNIIIKSGDNSVTLIDFGISRKFNENTGKDTAIFATQGFAPPEQFGFAQTDTRTDIYSLGILLRYMLTGTTESCGVINDRALEQIIKKCAALDPKERFQNVFALKKALKKYKPHPKYKAFRVTAAVLILGFVFIGGFALGRLTAPVPEPEQAEPPVVQPNDPPVEETPPSPYNEYVFTEPLIEQAARLMLGKDEDEPVTYGELSYVTEIIVFGAYPSDSHNRDWDNFDMGYGNIKNLDDFRAMPNLRVLRLQNQPLSDISALAENLQLELLILNSCNVSDFSVLAQLPRLNHVELYHTFISDYSIFEKIELLENLKIIHDRNIKSISEFGNVSGVNYLNLCDSTIENLNGIENITELIELNIEQTPIHDFSPLNDVEVLPHLNRLVISADMEQYLDTLNREGVEVVIFD